MLLHYSPLLKNTCIRQVVLDKRFPLSLGVTWDKVHGKPPANGRPGSIVHGQRNAPISRASRRFVHDALTNRCLRTHVLSLPNTVQVTPSTRGLKSAPRKRRQTNITRDGGRHPGFAHRMPEQKGSWNIERTGPKGGESQKTIHYLSVTWRSLRSLRFLRVPLLGPV